jgi:hypothetical protein
VELFPSRPEDYRLNHPVGALLLAYPGSRFAATTLHAQSVCQDRIITLSVSLVSRHLWGTDGAVALMDRLRAALLGWRPTDCQPVTAVSDRLLAEQAGLWWYAADFACTTRVTATPFTS